MAASAKHFLDTQLGRYLMSTLFVGVGLETARYVILFPNEPMPLLRAASYPLMMPMAVMLPVVENTRAGPTLRKAVETITPALV